MATFKKMDNNSVGEDVEELEPSYLSDGNEKCLSHLGNSSGRFPKTLKIELLYDPAISFLDSRYLKCMPI